MIKGLENLVKFGFNLGDAVRAASANPARIMGYTKKGSIIPGFDADITVFDKNWNILAVLVEGELKINELE
jgi:N-acetylglucosamine-6-phosphate deacetylase